MPKKQTSATASAPELYLSVVPLRSHCDNSAATKLGSAASARPTAIAMFKAAPKKQRNINTSIPAKEIDEPALFFFIFSYCLS
jgi:hypothetical protein